MQTTTTTTPRHRSDSSRLKWQKCVICATRFEEYEIKKKCLTASWSFPSKVHACTHTCSRRNSICTVFFVHFPSCHRSLNSLIFNSCASPVRAVWALFTNVVSFGRVHCALCCARSQHRLLLCRLWARSSVIRAQFNHCTRIWASESSVSVEFGWHAACDVQWEQQWWTNSVLSFFRSLRNRMTSNEIAATELKVTRQSTTHNNI